MKKRETIDLVILLVYPILASISSLLFNVNAFGSVLLFLLIPSLFLSIRAKQYIKKSLLFSAVLGIPLMIVIDYIAHITKQWLIPNSILPFRLFGVVTIEVIMWVYFLIYFTIMFYEYFLDKHITKRLWHPHMKYLVVFVLASFSIFLILLFNYPTLLNIPYFYLVFGIILILVPISIELFEYPALSSKFFKTAAYFFYLTFIYEVTALKLGWWDFPGVEFIGWLSILGVKFPFEELFFWLMLGALACLSYYEFFDDDEK